MEAAQAELPQGEVIDNKEEEAPPKKKRGRPPGSGNKPKEGKAEKATPEAEVDIAPLINEAVLMLSKATGDYRYKVLVDEGDVTRFYKMLEATGEYYGIKVNQGVLLIAGTAATGLVTFAKFKSLPPPEVDVPSEQNK